ncbi:MAG TPA: Gfo/Idh/MocA family oxidoreductase [Planctomycetia bacterium]|nr:Gfo/Idh/MocA family oxidoreductase [Planctomycetia bacterium]
MLVRREFLGAAAAAVAGSASAAGSHPAADRLVVGIMGTGGRGMDHARNFSKIKGVEVGYVCDADMNRAQSAADALLKIGAPKPKVVQDFRRILDDREVDVLIVATCNHWHAPAAILGCTAGKHVYVEKPCSHNPREGELLVEAASKNKRQVQMGNQRRSWPKVREAIEFVRGGGIGNAYFAKCWYANGRGSIGKGQAKPVPAGLDYALWEGPAPHREYRDNTLHYNWHWFWHWGNGELGNNGVHMIDVCRWGLGVDACAEVSSTGGRFRWQDDQETPDTNLVSYVFPGGKQIAWEGLSCSQMPENRASDVVFVGDKGSLSIKGGGYVVYDPKGKQIKKVEGKGADAEHVGNFIEAIRSGESLNSPITEGHVSTLLCHLGNIAYRVKRTLKCDPKSGAIHGDSEAMTHWSREYAKGWEPKV